MAEVFCPFHSSKWRSVSQFVINRLRHKELISNPQGKRFPRAICSCEDGKDTKLPVTLPALPSKDSITQWMMSNIIGEDKQMKSSLDRLIKAAKDSKVSEEYRQVLNRAIGVIYLVYNNETEFLNPPKPRPVTPPTTSDPPLDNPISFKEEVFYLTIPVSPVTYIGTLIGTNGRHLKALCSQYKIESIHLGEHPLKPKQIGSAPRRIRRPRNTAGMVSLFISSPVKVVILFNPANEDISMKFKDALKERVQKVCQERKKHFETVQRYQAARLARYQEWRKHKQEEIELRKRAEEYYNELTDEKGGYRVTGVEKRKNNKKDKQKSRPPPILENSKCLHCKQPHSTAEKTECIYHPGYPVAVKKGKSKSQRWTCCNQYYRSYNTQITEHNRTGCTHGNHIWRPVGGLNKKKSKPATNNSEVTEDTVVTAQKKK